MAALYVDEEANKTNKNSPDDSEAEAKTEESTMEKLNFDHVESKIKEVEKSEFVEGEEAVDEQPRLYVPPFLREGYKLGHKYSEKYQYQFDSPPGDRYRLSYSPVNYQTALYRPTQMNNYVGGGSLNCNFQSPIYRPDMVSSRDSCNFLNRCQPMAFQSGQQFQRQPSKRYEEHGGRDNYSLVRYYSPKPPYKPNGNEIIKLK
ncbi:hypothetical protein ACTXT7_005030 [Hymenolepis weldensis]